MESTNSSTPVFGNPGLSNRAPAVTMIRPRWIATAYWVITALFCLEMCFTAYYEFLPQGAQAFARLGFPSDAFRVELSLAKLVGAAALLLPMIPARVKEWAYAGFAINLVSALIAHTSISDRPAAFFPSSITLVLWAFSYYFWRRLSFKANSRSAEPRA